jgi:hypothetical protein
MKKLSMRMKVMIKKISTILLLVCSMQAYSQPLGKDAPERKQLIAMGYDIEKEVEGDTFTIVNTGSNKMAFSKNAERLVISRYFIRERRNLSSADEYELLKLINTFNKEYSYQFSVGEEVITAAVFDFGIYDPKSFARMVRMVDKVNFVFDLYPQIYKLVNK